MAESVSPVFPIDQMGELKKGLKNVFFIVILMKTNKNRRFR